jgi:thymidylate kinase
MVLVIEGIEGTGKTTLARALGGVVYRALRGERRLYSHEIGRWRSLGVPVNTHAEDIFIADLLAALPQPGLVILDRSLLTGLVYDNTGLKEGHKRELFSEWEARMAQAGARLLLLTCEPERAGARLAPGDARKEVATLAARQAGLEALWERSQLRKDTLDTGHATLEEAVSAAHRLIGA